LVDVSNSLEFERIKKALQEHIEDEYKKTLKELSEGLGVAATPNPILGQNNLLNLTYHIDKAVYINEPGLYSLIMASKAPMAKEFKAFVCNKVLPSIRKYGQYIHTQQLALEFEQKLKIKDQTHKQELEQKDQELAEEREYRLGLEEGLLANTTPIEPLQVIYIATSLNYSKQNRFKVGGVATLEHLEGRLATYNTRSANGDDFFYTEWYSVVCFRVVEKILETLIGRFKDRKAKEIYIMHYTNLKYVVEYVIANYNEEVETINQNLSEFITNLNRRKLRPVAVVPKALARVQIQQVGHPDVVITTDTREKLICRLETFIQDLRRDTQVVNAKQVFDTLDIKTRRREIYPVLLEVVKKVLPNAKMVKF